MAYTEGELVDAYNRQYKYIKPQSSEPGTFRLATPPDAAHGGGSGGGGSTVIVGEDPIQVAQTVARADIALDITSLPYI